jgi:hypothetical protein
MNPNWASCSSSFRLFIVIINDAFTAIEGLLMGIIVVAKKKEGGYLTQYSISYCPSYLVLYLHLL